MIPQINKFNLNFPHPNEANEDGLLAWGGDLQPERLLHAYRNGIFPWFSKHDPILWFSPTPRLIMELDEFKISKSLKKSMHKFTYKFDSNFSQVIYSCSTKQRNGKNDTWIQPSMIKAYTELHKLGIAHSI